MTKKSLVPIELPGNPTQNLEAATKQYVDTKVGLVEVHIHDEGSSVSPIPVNQLFFTGAGVTATNAGPPEEQQVFVNIPGTPSGTAAGDLAGSYPNPTIGTGKVTSTHIADGTITTTDLASATRTYIEDAAPDAKQAGSMVVSNPTAYNFTGAGVTVTAAGAGAADVAIPGAAGGVIPVGSIVMWATATPPTDWLICNGQATTGYPALAAIVGANVPNLAGKFPLGVGTTTPSGTSRTLLSTSGADERTLIANNLPRHTHTVPMRETTNLGGPQNAAPTTAGVGGAARNPDTSDGGFPSPPTAFGIMPNYLALNFIIKAA